MEIINAPVYNIHISKKGRYFRIHEILLGCIIPNIQVGDVIVSIGRWEIDSDTSLEELDQIIQETGHEINVMQYRSAVAKDRRDLQRISRVQEQVILANCF